MYNKNIQHPSIPVQKPSIPQRQCCELLLVFLGLQMALERLELIRIVCCEV